LPATLAVLIGDIFLFGIPSADKYIHIIHPAPVALREHFPHAKWIGESSVTVTQRPNSTAIFIINMPTATRSWPNELQAVIFLPDWVTVFLQTSDKVIGAFSVPLTVRRNKDQRLNYILTLSAVFAQPTPAVAACSGMYMRRVASLAHRLWL